ncbi:MAG: Holliday junction branch migration protein RuvA [Clostridiales bacterium]|nr:Holliday junction branch migration protein RuvA [Clostridiales bacterium]PWL49362.1 MAG: Holliday junction branch migration protein RuvA [Clostridiales bacterium]
MYDYFKGTLAFLRTDAAVVECGGVGYRLAVSASTHAKLSPLLGREATLFAYLAVREDAMELYGFSDETERALFIHLLSVSGVGPKAALSVLSTLPADRLAVCVAAGDAKAIASAPGVGLKTAQKIILELKDKLAKEFASGEPLPDGVPSDGADDASDAVNALVVLGYSRAQALGALKGLDSALPLEIRIREALKKLY